MTGCPIRSFRWRLLRVTIRLSTRAPVSTMAALIIPCSRAANRRGQALEIFRILRIVIGFVGSRYVAVDVVEALEFAPTVLSALRLSPRAGSRLGGPARADASPMRVAGWCKGSGAVRPHSRRGCAWRSADGRRRPDRIRGRRADGAPSERRTVVRRPQLS